MAENLRDIWDFNDPIASEARFDDALSQLPSGATDEDRVVILTQKARATGMQRRFDDARQTLEEAKALVPPNSARAEGWYEIELGRVENSSGHPDKARKHFLKAFELAEANNLEFLAIDAAHMLGIVDKGQAGLDWNEKAIEMAERAQGARARNWLGSLLNNTGWTYYDLGNHEKAMEIFEKAVEFRKQAGKEPEILIARYCVAKCHRAMGHLELSLEMQLDLETENLAQGRDPGFTYEEIAECLLALNQDQEAKIYFKRAFDILSKDEWLVDSEPDRVARLGHLAGSA